MAESSIAKNGGTVTGRDYTILTQALAYAIVTIDRLPAERQECSNRDDMWTLLTARVGVVERERLLKQVRLQMAAPMNLEPAAPDLLMAAKALLDPHPGIYIAQRFPLLVDALEAAIAKVEGREVTR